MVCTTMSASENENMKASLDSMIFAYHSYNNKNVA